MARAAAWPLRNGTNSCFNASNLAFMIASFRFLKIAPIVWITVTLAARTDSGYFFPGTGHVYPHLDEIPGVRLVTRLCHAAVGKN